MSPLTIDRAGRTSDVGQPEAVIRFPEDAESFTTDNGLRVKVRLDAAVARDLIARLGAAGV